MTDERELLQLKKRLTELARRSYEQGIYTFTPCRSSRHSMKYNEKWRMRGLGWKVAVPYVNAR